MPYDEQAEETMREDFKRLWATSFLENLSIEVADYVFANGVVGKLVTYQMEERERVKIVNYQDGSGSSIDVIKRTDIDEQLGMRGIELKLDSFVDNGTIRRIESVLREMMAEKGYSDAAVSHKITAVAGGPKLVNVTFLVGEGPKIKIREIDFVGNVAMSDGTLRGKMKENKPKGFLPFIGSDGTYKEARYESDADLVQAYYRTEGYVRARVAQPEVNVLEDSPDGKTRWIQLRIPVTEGPRYRIGEFAIEGNEIVTSEALRPLFKVKTGDWYDEKEVREGLVKVQEIYGGGGYMEFTGFPDLKLSDEPDAAVPAALVAPPSREPPTADVTMRIQEGKQYLVNRITFVGNTTTRDNVIRRELRLVEGATFDTQALKYSIRRLNQLGYFEQIEEDDQQATRVVKTPGPRRCGRRHGDAEGAESKPAHVRRRGVAVRRAVRPAGLPDRQLSRPRREPLRLAAGGRPVAELSARVHRALSLRPQHHRWHRRPQDRAAVHRLLHAEIDRRQPDVRIPGG